jgi:hypothetical protein
MNKPIVYVSCNCKGCGHDIDTHHAEPIGCAAAECSCKRFEVRVETRSDVIARGEAEGWLVKDCPGCHEFYETPLMPYDVHAPGHVPSQFCESGRKPHCTCESCW